MLEKFLEELECIQAAYEILHKTFPLSELNIHAIRELERILNVFYIAAKNLQGDQYTTCSTIVPIFKGISTVLQTSIIPTLVHICSIDSANYFLSRTEWRECTLVSQDNFHRYLVTTALDPRYLHLRHLNIDQRIYVKERLREELSENIPKTRRSGRNI
eukprot:TRINITY_DN11294_c0_g1_i1.p1 TRINITY_DN11294_c0_g1~~TRINITY_DN11294_c0_g1_i1.p1  ORF type:complete len:159 (+),score=23.33 TRINITY_DN11294_c0_g1_i1:791-1267(+)